MRTVYKSLFSIRFRHSFYKGSTSTKDFLAFPSPATARKLHDYGFVFRQLTDGLAVYSEIEPDSAQPKLYKPIGEDNLRFTFFLRLLNPHIWNISDLPDSPSGENVFYFNNLREDISPLDGRLHLGDSVDNRRVGSAVKLVTQNIFTYRLSAPVNKASFEVQDVFGSTVLHTHSSFPDPTDITAEYRIELNSSASLVPGRYKVKAKNGLPNEDQEREFYYDPELTSLRPFAVIEIFSSTARFTSDNSDLVPQDYRFLIGDILQDLDAYYIQLESRSTVWRYLVLNKYNPDDTDLSSYDISDIEGSLSFISKTEQKNGLETKVFTSVGTEALSDHPPRLFLHKGSKKILDLPGPHPSASLADGANAGSYISEMYIYV